MKKYSIYMFFLAVLFAQCSKKTTDGMVDKSKATATKVVDQALAWRSKAPGAGEARPIKLGTYNSFDMANGLKVIVVENHKLPRVSYQLSLNNNPIMEKDQVGYVSMAGDLMSMGTKTKSKSEIDAAIDFIGASLNTGGNGIYASSLKKHSSKLLDIMTDVLYNPSFPADEFKKLQTQTLSNLASSTSDANAMARNVAAAVNYGSKHPYGEIQREENVNSISVEKCKEYYNTFFKPNNAYLIIVGDITPAEAKVNVEKYFGKWQKGNVPSTSYATPTGPQGTNVSFANKDGAVQSVIRVTYPVDLKPGADDLIPARVMNSILGGGIFSGRLMQNLREDKAYTYGARSNVSADEIIGNFNAFASVRNAVTDSSVTEFLFEMNRLRDEPVSEEDLQLVKNSMTGSFARSLESPQTIARFARNTYKFGLPADYYETYLQKLNAVTVADVQRMAKKYIRPDKANIVIAGSKDDVAASLLKFDADGVIDYYDAFGKKMEMNDKAMPEGVTAKSIIGDYIDAIGGKAKLMAVNSMVQKSTMDLMGQTANAEMGTKDNRMMYVEMSLGGQMMQEQRFNGTKAKVGAMGQNQVITEGAELEAMKQQAINFIQLNYLNRDSKFKTTLKGMEDLNGSKVYKIEVIDASGKKSYEYYDVKSNLLVRSMSSEEGPDGQSMTLTNDFEDYKAVEGVMFPYTTTITGAMPFPLKMEVQSIEINKSIPAEKFKVD